jgi:hypothetical protein
VWYGNMSVTFNTDERPADSSYAVYAFQRLHASLYNQLQSIYSTYTSRSTERRDFFQRWNYEEPIPYRTELYQLNNFECQVCDDSCVIAMRSYRVLMQFTNSCSVLNYVLILCVPLY